MIFAAPLIRIPPFPRARIPEFARAALSSAAPDKMDLEELIALTARERVGGTYWGSQPDLPAGKYALIAARRPDDRRRILQELGRDRSVFAVDPKQICDPWHLISRADELIADADDELALIASIAGVPVRCIGERRLDLHAAFAERVLAFSYADPFTGEPISARQVIELSVTWRKLIDANRTIDAVLGIAAWKRETMEALLWAGPGTPNFRTESATSERSCIALWRSRTSQATVANLEHGCAELIEIEDGFIRSAGLGADCVPPLSIVVDRSGIYFDPSRPSDLERLLEEGSFPAHFVQRAKALRELIVAYGISKYEAVAGGMVARNIAKRLILVPGQVEDDRAVTEGGFGLTSNRELLQRVRAQAPDAHILYKPHPDVEAGHRRGGMADRNALAFADEIVRDTPISQLIDAADEVHVNTSLAGFEALLRSKPVTTYGVPFYAGWGLTTDLGPVPERRTARRSLDELVAAALILYPRYLDPKTGLPCPPEILVHRLAEGQRLEGMPALIWLRRLQGRLRRQLASMAHG